MKVVPPRHPHFERWMNLQIISIRISPAFPQPRAYLTRTHAEQKKEDAQGCANILPFLAFIRQPSAKAAPAKHLYRSQVPGFSRFPPEHQHDFT